MSDKPILFSAPMVRALLAGTKTQTRRVASVKRGIMFDDLEWEDFGNGMRCGRFRQDQMQARIAVGDRLYVREAWTSDTRNIGTKPSLLSPTEPVWYIADDGTMNVTEWSLRAHQTRPGMFMPRWASRLTLAVTDVRVLRLQDISDEDARAEGTPCYVCGRTMDGKSESDCHCFHRHADAGDYRHLWEHINGSGSWDKNPWVAAYTFMVERANIDAARTA